MTENEIQTWAFSIYKAFDKAYTSKDPDDVKDALRFARIVVESGGCLKIELVEELKKYGIKPVWNRTQNSTSISIDIGLQYKDMALQLEDN